MQRREQAQDFAGFHIDGESPSRALETPSAGGGTGCTRWCLLESRDARGRRSPWAPALPLACPYSVLRVSQVSEVEMRGMLALEMELSVEEILVYRDVARWGKGKMCAYGKDKTVGLKCHSRAYPLKSSICLTPCAESRGPRFGSHSSQTILHSTHVKARGVYLEFPNGTARLGQLPCLGWPSHPRTSGCSKYEVFAPLAYRATIGEARGGSRQSRRA